MYANSFCNPSKIFYIAIFSDRWGYSSYRRRENTFSKGGGAHKRFDNVNYFDA